MLVLFLFVVLLGLPVLDILTLPEQNVEVGIQK
jgi:hypothetical protein